MRIEGQKTTAYFETLSESDWGQQVYTTGTKWSIRHILAHFVSAERAFIKYLKDALAGEKGVSREFDIDEFNEKEVKSLAAEPTSDLISAFQEARGSSLQLVEEITESDLSRKGYHPWFGDSTLESMLKLIYRHNMIHLRDIRKALAAQAPVPHVDIVAPAAQQKEEAG